MCALATALSVYTITKQISTRFTAYLEFSALMTTAFVNGVETERRSYKGLKLLKLGAMPCKLKLYQNLFLL